MAKIIKFIDADADGLGTDIEICVQVNGTPELTPDIVKEVEKVVRETVQGDDEWDTNTVVDAACEYLESRGYTCDSVYPDYEIEF